MIHRRDAMLRLGQFGLGALSLPGVLAAERANATPTAVKPKAKSCILIYLWGGPPQQDMWDLKPEAPDGIRSQFQPIDTVVPGIQICDQLPRMAKHTDKLAIVRSLTHGSNNHEPSVYHTLTGKTNPTLAVPRNQRTRNDFPNPAAVLSHFSPPAGLPASVTLPRPIGHDGVTYAGTYAGFLGPRHDPMELRAAGDTKAVPTHSLDLPEGLDATRITSRIGLLKLIEQFDRTVQENGALPNGVRQNAAGQGPGEFREQAYRLLTSPDAKGAFDLAREPDVLRDQYGRNEYGESFLLARRLVASGVRLVSVIWMYIFPNGRVSNVWDNHSGIGIHGAVTGYDLLKGPVCLPPLDQAFSALLDDLQRRGLLDETLVLAMGEFGRTPNINATGGRDHWGACQSIVLAGGGVRGGQVHGASDRHAAFPKQHPFSPEDVLATVYHAMGISPESLIYDRQNRPHRVCEGQPITALFG
ncbi:MAG TPA: DUF1501 domain-containing protein [Pirellulales bacterium]|nr:DUF1501 domain-containing protein [Pirellulales bacterium]